MTEFTFIAIYIIDCNIKTITNATEFRQPIKFTPKCTAISMEKSTFWNINTTNEIRGYWINRNEIKTFLKFEKDGNLLVSIFFLSLLFILRKMKILQEFYGKDMFYS